MPDPHEERPPRPPSEREEEEEEQKHRELESGLLFRSVSFRLGQVGRWRSGESAMFAEPPAFSRPRQGPIPLLRRVPRLGPGVRTELLYRRDKTESYIVRAEARGEPALIIKVFRVGERAGPGGGVLLESHEVEARYLGLLQGLMERGVTDASAMLLGLITLDRRALEGAGFWPEGTELAPAKREGARYALLFAEAGDLSLTSYLHGLAVRAWGSPAALGYELRAVCFLAAYALAAVHSVFPSFTHLDLHSSNWLVQRIPVDRLRRTLGVGTECPLVVEYGYGGRRWQIDVERAPFRLLFWDLFYAGIDERDAERAGAARTTPRDREYSINVRVPRTDTNQYCDLHKTLDTLRWVLRRSKRGDCWEEAVPAEARHFLERVVPEELGCAELEQRSKLSRGDRRRLRERLARVVALVPGGAAPTTATRTLLTDPFFSAFEVDASDAGRPRPLYRLHVPCEGVGVGAGLKDVS